MKRKQDNDMVVQMAKTHYPSEQLRQQCIAEMSKTIRVIEEAGEFRVLVTHPGDGENWHRVPGAFESEGAALLFRDDLVLAAVDGINNESVRSTEDCSIYYNSVARLLCLIETHRGDSRDLAKLLARNMGRLSTASETPS